MSSNCSTATTSFRKLPRDKKSGSRVSHTAAPLVRHETSGEVLSDGHIPIIRRSAKNVNEKKGRGQRETSAAVLKTQRDFAPGPKEGSTTSLSRFRPELSVFRRTKKDSARHAPDSVRHCQDSRIRAPIPADIARIPESELGFRQTCPGFPQTSPGFQNPSPDSVKHRQDSRILPAIPPDVPRILESRQGFRKLRVRSDKRPRRWRGV